MALVLLLTLLVWPASAAQDRTTAPPQASVGQRPGAIPSEMDEAAYTRAAVTLDGEVLFLVRGTSAYPAEQRAEAIQTRIEAIAADRSIAVESLRTEDAPDRTSLLAGNRHIMSVFDADAALEGVKRQVLGELIKTSIASAILDYRHDRSPKVLLYSTAYTVGATLGFLGLLFGLRRAARGLMGLVERRLKSHVEVIETQAHRLIQAAQIWKAVRGFIHGLYILTALVVAYLYLELVLGFYPWTRPLAVRLFAIFWDPLRSMGMGFRDALPGLVFVAILILITRYSLRLFRLFFTGIDQGTITLAQFDRDWALPTYRIVRLLLIAFMVVVAYPHIPGSHSEAFKGVSIFIGVIFSLGSTSFVANLIAGYGMTYSRAFKVGDRIRVSDLTGDVIEIRPMVTQLRTVKNEEIVVPNAFLVNSHVINYSTLARSRGLILHTTVGIGYATPWRQVEAILLLAAERTPGLLRDPAPFVLQKSLGDFCITYELNVYCDNAQAMTMLYSKMHQNILDLFNEYNVQIMTPAYEGDPEAPKVVPKDEWFQPPARPSQTPGTDPRSS